MKKVLIIYPHFPPSNLAGVHRPRLFANHLNEFGWDPVILTVHETYYEEMPDWNLVKLLPKDLRIEKVKAFKITNPRLIGDIGLRAFFQLYMRAKQLIKTEGFNFLYIPIPSFYCALLGRWLYKSTRIPYGVDYIDPWVHQFPGSDKVFSRHWFSTQIAKFLEPIAIKNACLITGVSEGYYKSVLERNRHLKIQAIQGAMPYGGESKDHEMLASLNGQTYLFEKKAYKIQLVYAGAMLPKAYEPLKAIFKTIAVNKDLFEHTEFHFIGTGSRVDDAESYSIRTLAENYGLWQTVVFEYPKRIPYLDVLLHLHIASAIFILGSTESHYTPSKTYQGVLSKKPLLAVLHEDSTAVKIITDSRAGLVLDFKGENDIKKIEKEFASFFEKAIGFINSFDAENVDQKVFEQYTAKAVTKKLAGLLNRAIKIDE